MGDLFNKLKKVAKGNGYKESEMPDFDQPGAVVQWFTGGGGQDNYDLEMLEQVERHSARLNTRQNVGLTSLSLINQRYNDPIINEFIENWMLLRVHSKESARDINKSIEYIYNKRFTENINTSMKLQK